MIVCLISFIAAASALLPFIFMRKILSKARSNNEEQLENGIEDMQRNKMEDDALKIIKVISAFKNKNFDLNKIKEATELIRAASPREKREMVDNGSVEELCKIIRKTRIVEMEEEADIGFFERWFGDSERTAPRVYRSNGNGTGYSSYDTYSSGNLTAEMEKVNEKVQQSEEKMTVLIEALISFIQSKEDRTKFNKEEINMTYIDNYVVDQIRNSEIIEIMKEYLRNSNIDVISKKITLFKTLFELTAAMAKSSSLINLLLEPDRTHSLAEDVLPKFVADINRYMELFGKEVTEDTNTIDFCRRMNDVAKIVSAAIKNVEPKKEENNNNVTEIQTEKDIDSKYKETMKKYQMRQYRMIDDNGKFLVPLAFEKEVKKTDPTTSTMRTRTKKIAKEISLLMTSLPLNASNSIFIMVDESRCDVIKAIITGPDDTPYANGLFEFDIFFPNNYPVSPPKVELLTTNAGLFRFNPNLYADGKVCLSLLGTWLGSKDETWTKQSSLLQVLISIQSLILVKDPYFNEPAYQTLRGTTNGELASKTYNIDIELGTILYAIHEFFKAPKYLEDLARNHISLKKNDIILKCKEWIQKAKDNEYKNIPEERINSIIKDLKKIS